MDVHVATRFTRSMVSMLARAPLGDPQFVFRNFSRKEASWKVLLSKEERQEMITAKHSIVDYELGVKRFLLKCEARRSKQRPPPKGISWGNRPKWDCKIVNLTLPGR